MPIELEDIEARRKAATFTYFGNEVHVAFWVDKITKSFRAEILRLQRASGRVKQRQVELKAQIDSFKEQPDTPEAKEEDAIAERAIKQLQADDDALKAEIDAALLIVLASWDVMSQGRVVPITLENLAKVADDFEGEILKAIYKEAEPMGEAKSDGNMKPSQPYWRRKGLASMKRARSSRHRAG